MIDSVYEAGKMIKYKSNKQGENIVQQAYGFGKQVFNHPPANICCSKSYRVLIASDC